MIQLNLPPNGKYVELGGGDNPQIRPNVDCRKGPKVDIVADFNQPLPFKDNEYDGAFSQFALEHISWRNVPGFLKEVLRILKPGAKFVCAIPNTEAQMLWIANNRNGWDDKGPFESCSEVIFGSQDYPENSHKAYFSPGIADMLFSALGFINVVINPYGERDTDMVIEAYKPNKVSLVDKPSQKLERQVTDINKGAMSREEMFDRVYFNGGEKVGGYAREGYRDFACHELTAQHILSRRPESVLELGAARGYVLKRLKSAGVETYGLEISEHCVLTRVTDGIRLYDLCDFPWPSMHFDDGGKIDLCYSIATLEHIPENYVPMAIKEMASCCKRGLHGIDFGTHDDGFDRTHVTLKPREWWLDQFKTHAPNWPVEVVSKEELETGQFPGEVLNGDGKVKVAVGTATNMIRYGWINISLEDLGGFAQQERYVYKQHDIKNGLPFPTNSVDMIWGCHVFEHLSYEEGRKFLVDCRRVMKPNGLLRLTVPDADLLTRAYTEGRMDDWEQINSRVAAATTQARKLWALLHEGHQAIYDELTLLETFREAGFSPVTVGLTTSQSPQMMKEIMEIGYGLSLFVEGFPLSE